MPLPEMADPHSPMQVCSTIEDVWAAVRHARIEGLSVGFVPTMGALHAGHVSLLGAALAGNDFVVASIFVNPTQFGPGEDFEAYPRDAGGDLAMLRSAGVHAVFVPEVGEMYPLGEPATVVAPGSIGRTLEGAYRPGHFSGVATVCAKLFNIVRPDRVYMGQKDAQQLAVVRQMVQDLNMPLEVVACPTVREPDGLAMSSRNRLLSLEERSAAAVLPEALYAALLRAGKAEKSAHEVLAHARELIERQPLVRLQYLEVVDPRSFQPVEHIAAGHLIVLAAFVGSVRLIDNMQVPGGAWSGPPEAA